MTASGQVLPQIRVHAGAAAPEGHVQQAQVAAALGVGREFAVHLEALLAQPLAGPAEFDADVLLVQAQQRGGHGQGFGLDLGVPQHGPGGLGEPLERTGQQPPAGRRQQPGRGAPAGSTAGAQRGMEEFLAAVGVPLGRDTADGDQHLGPPGGGRAALPQGGPEEPGEGGRGEHPGGARSVRAQPGVGEGRRPVPVEEFTDGMHRGRRSRPLLQFGAQHFVRRACLGHGRIPPDVQRGISPYLWVRRGHEAARTST
ncbi:hypothetical protein [Streptomyces sp. FBKL.4005]|uniref:hypothetical protein n=1 Tax=Streptomyces sp. FBKL.4005 TaxID=2015515 RepID=UPI003983D311